MLYQGPGSNASFSAPATARSYFTGESYLQLASYDTWSHLPYIKHLLHVHGARLLYPVEDVIAQTQAAYPHLPGVWLKQRGLMDAVYYETVRKGNGLAMRLTIDELVLVDNRRFTHAVLPSNGFRFNAVAMLGDRQQIAACAAG